MNLKEYPKPAVRIFCWYWIYSNLRQGNFPFDDEWVNYLINELGILKA